MTSSSPATHALAPAKVLRSRATGQRAQRARHHVERRQRVAIAGASAETSQKAGRTVTFVSAEAVYLWSKKETSDAVPVAMYEITSSVGRST